MTCVLTVRECLSEQQAPNHLIVGLTRTERHRLRAGGTASGKTTVCNDIMQRLHDQVAWSFRHHGPPMQIQNCKLSRLAGSADTAAVSMQCVVMLSQDSFYRGLSTEELADVACKPALIWTLASFVCSL